MAGTLPARSPEHGGSLRSPMAEAGILGGMFPSTLTKLAVKWLSFECAHVEEHTIYDLIFADFSLWVFK